MFAIFRGPPTISKTSPARRDARLVSLIVCNVPIYAVIEYVAAVALYSFCVKPSYKAIPNETRPPAS